MGGLGGRELTGGAMGHSHGGAEATTEAPSDSASSGDIQMDRWTMYS